MSWLDPPRIGESDVAIRRWELALLSRGTLDDPTRLRIRRPVLCDYAELLARAELERGTRATA